MWRLLGVWLSMFAASVAFVSNGRAESSYCTSLRQQYAAASGGVVAVNAEAISRKLTGRQADAAANGCAGFSPARSATAQCPAILSDIRLLRAQLAQAQSGRSASPRLALLDRIRQQLNQNGCGADQPTVASMDGFSVGQGRTLCVRTCDGYYFPISNIGSRSRYKTDVETCQSMYAAAGQAELFVQRRSGDMATAISADGKLKYGDQPYAFAFRQGFNQACQAQLHAGLTALEGRYFEALRTMPHQASTPGQSSAAVVYWPMPHQRPDAVLDDPETAAVRAGSFGDVFAPARRPVVVAAIRHVGEAWYLNLYDTSRPPQSVHRHRPPLGFDLIGSALADEAVEPSLAGVPTQ